ncbi:Fructose-1,6-bisphosphatase, cytosolic [Zancudomyces culisetae]|uniref:Fructose-1,6-bisphosphatase n=1 Tax=Zancudomyces culisetae TaxID=1213189 RepID=A0A1R1PX38_ZANCU|nr:Fructose-1,6-bisphosphatase, cytosolic [Zancudomyces culisetae]|eukprot:OMH85483.1 Fructose-1,6-bisphosphatase, cytosolic [Zancudomyces culisetae]
MSEHFSTDIKTLTRYILETQKHHPTASGDLTILMSAIQVGCKFVESCVRKASLVNLVGLAGNVNVQGEEQKKLDELSNDMFINALRASGKVKTMVSEEIDNVIICEGDGKYCVTFDPLDGSSNIDAGVNVGTIFGIFKHNKDSKTPEDDYKVPGSDIIIAGYCMYGSSCNLVIAIGEGQVDGFTLDPSLGEFILTHPSIRMPSRGKIYSANEGNSLYWDEATRKYIDSVKYPQTPGTKPYVARYIGSMVADVHRTLLYGGIFAYPSDTKSKDGKLRILYEGFPMAYICEQAGGKATTGLKRVLDLVPKDVHARCPIFLGSKEDVEDVEKTFAIYETCLPADFK